MNLYMKASLQVDKGHCRINHEGDALMEYSRFYDYSSSYPDEEEGDRGDQEEEVRLDQLDDTGFELVLPSGARVGHRSLMRYYRQDLAGILNMFQVGVFHARIYNFFQAEPEP